MANKDPMCKTRPPRKYFFFKVTHNQEAVKTSIVVTHYAYPDFI